MSTETDLRQFCKKQFPSITFDEPLAKYSTFKIGGPADFFYRLKNNTELQHLIRFCNAHNLPHLIMGGGSNILFDDSGFRGLVIKIETQSIKIEGNAEHADISGHILLTADSGVLISQLLNFIVKEGLSGLEPWEGLPGTVGGAVRGNAGCNGLETREILQKATLLDTHTCETHHVDCHYFEYQYRHGKLKNNKNICLDATFRLKKREISKAEQLQIIENFKKTRKEKQPFGFTTGSFFKNPDPKHPAGKLIEQAGLKGKIIGKAKISEKHGNFFLNLGGATSQNIIELAKFAIRQVKAKFGLTLEEEVQIVSETGIVKLS